MFKLAKFLVKAVHLLSVVAMHALLDEVSFLKHPDLICFPQILCLTLQEVFFLKNFFLVGLIESINAVKKFNFLAYSYVAMSA